MKQNIEKQLRALSDPDPVIRRKAAKKLGSRDQPEVVEALCGTLQDANYSVRAAAVRALGRIGDLAAIGPLCQALNDRTKTVCRCAFVALVQYTDRSTTAVLLDLLRDRRKKQRACAREGLLLSGLMGIPLLCLALTSDQPDLQQEAENLIPQLRGDEAQMLNAILADPRLSPEQRYVGMEALRESWRGLTTLFWIRIGTYRYCQEARAKSQVAVVRAGAKAVMDYITLARPSQRGIVDSDQLLRAAQPTKEAAPDTLLQAANPPADPPPVDVVSWRDRLRRLLHRE